MIDLILYTVGNFKFNIDDSTIHKLSINNTLKSIEFTYRKGLIRRARVKEPGILLEAGTNADGMSITWYLENSRSVRLLIFMTPDDVTYDVVTACNNCIPNDTSDRIWSLIKTE